MTSSVENFYDAVRQVAYLCRGIDPKWYSSLDPKQENCNEGAAVLESMQRLQQLAIGVQCSSFVISAQSRESGKIKLGFTVKWLTERGHRLCERHWNLHALYRLTQRKIDFYLLCHGNLFHFQMIPEDSNCVEIDSSSSRLPESPVLQYLSMQKLDHHFVSLNSRSLEIQRMPQERYVDVLNIAFSCKEKAPEWIRSITGDNVDEEAAVRGCKDHLEALKTETLKCSLLIARARFEDARGKVRQLFLGFTPNPEHLEAQKKRFGLSSLYPLSEREANFYLLYNGRVAYMEMSSRHNTIVQLLKPDDEADLFNTSVLKLQNMIKKKWNGCFVTMNGLWDLVIPVPEGKRKR